MSCIYIAAPLFSQQEHMWNAQLAEALRNAGEDVFLPQESETPLLPDGTLDSETVFRRNLLALDAADVVLAVVDGADADSGTAWELGYAFAHGKRIVQVRSDLRASGDDETAGVNLMLSRSTDSFVRLERHEVDWQKVVRAI